MHSLWQNMKFREEGTHALLSTFIASHNLVVQEYGKSPLGNSSAHAALNEVNSVVHSLCISLTGKLKVALLQFKG